MSNINLKKIERKAYLTYYQDGIWDIAMGLGFLIIGIMVAFELASFVAIFAAVIAAMVSTLFKGKMSFTRSRIGQVEPSVSWKAKEKRQLKLLQIVGFISVVAGIFNFIAFTGHADWQTMIRNLGLIPFGMVLSSIIFIVGALLGMKRFMIYAVLILGMFIYGHYMGIPFFEYVILLGLIITISGVTVLVRFLRKYPKQNEDSGYGI
ncbi:MAG: hypothetical protein GY839_09250 [candidate division Zixibacteria bacterium]|nr:hypothetical protein [candidate division Zixibacteria bacterium]